MYTWKLNLFFVIGLILIAGVFNNTAIAAPNDGKGAIEVLWDEQDITSTLTVGDPTSDSEPLRAGTTHNMLEFTYTADDTSAIDMSGGRVRITFPSGWKVSNKLIQVTDGTTPGVVYETDAMGKLDTVIFDTEQKRTDANAKVIFRTDRDITVNLGSEWSGSRSTGRDLIIRLSDVTVPIPSRLTEPGSTADAPADSTTYRDNYAAIPFVCSSSARNGTLSRLSAPVAVNVGNILGNRVGVNRDGQPVSDITSGTLTRDPLIREVTVTPTRVFPGEENIPVRITFEAPGPMYGSSLSIDLPDALVLDTINASTVTVRSGGTLGDITYADPLIISISTLNRGQRITVSYRKPEVGTTADTTTVTTGIGGETAIAATVTGGVVSALAGSGRMEISPIFVEVGSQRRDITLTYHAYTALGTDAAPVDIEIVPAGIIIDSTNTLQTTAPNEYGYVSSSRSGVMVVGGTSASTAEIHWDGITLKKNERVRTTIRRVNISDAARNYEWVVRVGLSSATLNNDDHKLGDDPTTAVDDRAIFSVVKTSSDAVGLDFEGSDPSSQGIDTFPAGSRQTFTFTFTARDTPIRDGRVSLAIPSILGSAPTTTKDRPGRVTVTSNGMLEANQPTVSGRTINVAIKRLEPGQAVIIEYGTDDDEKESEKAVLHHTANDNIRVTGTFRVASGAGTRSTSPVTIKLGNIADGIGSATLSPTSIAAGSNDQAIEVIFTASGTMDGGRVSLEIPSGWGLMQDDPTRRNYVTTRGGAVSSLDVRGSIVEATVRRLARGGSFRFVYGGGTSSANNGVEVQDDIGIASFIVKSDGDADGVYAAVKSELKYEGREKVRNPKKVGRIYEDEPGVLQIEVSGAADGTGTVTVNPTEVRSAASDVRLEFTYTPGQTIADGSLRFTVPSGWSRPQVDDIGQPGYTEIDGTGLGTPTDDRFSVTIPIFTLDRTQSLTITYGAAATGLAVAPTATGTSTFRFEVQGSESGTLTAIQRQPTVTVTGQQSGSGRASIAVRAINGDSTLYAGDTRRTLTITYTAAGQIVGGRVRLTIPQDWSAPNANTVIVRPSATHTFDGQRVTVAGIDLNANSQVTFVYTGDVQPTREDGVQFGMEVHGGRPEDTFESISGGLTVNVAEARRGSGSGTVSPDRVPLGATGVTLNFTYTAVGEISAPREFRVQVPRSWTAPSAADTGPGNKGTYTIRHRNQGFETTASVEKIAPIGRDMVARVRLGGLEVEAGDQIIFTYANADAPSTAETSNFRILFDGVPIQDSTQVIVGTGGTTTDPEPPIDPVVIILTAEIDRVIAKAGETVVVRATGTAGQRATFTVGAVASNVAMTESPAGTYTGRFTVVDDVHDGRHAVTVNLDGPTSPAGTLTVDTDEPTVTVQASPAIATNGDIVTITATVSEAATSVEADASALDTTQTSPILLTLSNNTYRGSFTISDNNQATSAPHAITVTATDVAGNAGTGTATVTLTNTLSYTSTIPVGVSLFHVPLEVEDLNTVGDLRALLGDAVALMITYDSNGGTWDSRSDDVMITADLGIIISMIASRTLTFTGTAWGDGTSTISLHRGSNLIGLPVNDPDVTNVSDIISLFNRGVVGTIIVSTGPGQFHSVGQAGAPGDVPVMGDASYLVHATADATATLMGTGWRNGGATGAAPIPLVGYKVDSQTPVLSVEGAIRDEITGLVREGFRVKVKNLSTKAALSSITSVESASGYNMTFVDLTDGHAARVGDVLEISADSPSPLIGVTPVRHIVTVDDVKGTRIQLETLIAYEIPAETELLRNYPNPFNPETWIPYRLAEDADVTLTIYDSSGRLVRTLNMGHQIAAVYESRAKAIYWDGRNRFGEQVASGVYFYSLSAGDFSATRKMLILK